MERERNGLWPVANYIELKRCAVLYKVVLGVLFCISHVSADTHFVVLLLAILRLLLSLHIKLTVLVSRKKNLW